MTFVDLAHDLYDEMPGFKLKDETGQIIQYTAHVKSFMTHEESSPKFKGLAEFEITELNMQTSIGTYLDSPFHRFRNGRDISQLRLEELILDGVCINAQNMSAWQAFSIDQLPDIDMTGKAVLFCFGWDQHWGQDAYHTYPFLSEAVLYELLRRKVALVGVDTINIDDSRDLNRPAHTLLLRDEIFIVENLTNLHILLEQSFRFLQYPSRFVGGQL